jgi:hypothetical protein
LPRSNPEKVLKSPVKPPYVKMSNRWPGCGVKPLTSDTFNIPAKLAVPVTASWSYCVPAVAPPSTTSRADADPNVMSPA